MHKIEKQVMHFWDFQGTKEAPRLHKKSQKIKMTNPILFNWERQAEVSVTKAFILEIVYIMYTQ